MLFHTFQCKKLILSLCVASLLCTQTITAFAQPTDTEASDTATVDYDTDAAMRLEEPIDSNAIDGWPTGPVVGAEGAILLEANTGTILYAKNIHEHLYPASTTKILTTLVAIENSDLNDMVEFSNEAVFSIEQKSSNMGMDVGQSITMEQCLYGILVYSANEVCNAVGEHIAGSISGFVDMMNAKAAELGCKDSHFVTTNGLHDENHYTSPYDLATIARAFFSNETLTRIAGTSHYTIEPTATQPDLIDLYTHNKLTNNTYPYEGYIGGKTGYTSQAHQTLVSCAERNGMKLICVVMKEDAPAQFTDTIALFDYGFNNFSRVNVAQNETNYTVNNSDFFESNSNIFGATETIMSINPNDYVIVPNTITFSDLTSTLSYEDDASDPLAVASINYSYHDVSVGQAKVELNAQKDTYDFTSPVVESDSVSQNNAPGDKVIFINVIKVIAIVIGVIVLLLLLITAIAFFRNYHFSRRRRNKIQFKMNRKNRSFGRRKRRWDRNRRMK